MHLLLLPGIALLLGAGTALAAAAEPATPRVLDRSAQVQVGSGTTNPGPSDRSATIPARLSTLAVTLPTGRATAVPTCMGLPATPGGVGTGGDDVISGTSGEDVIVAGAGNDVIHGHDGRDTICGGPGGDTLVGGRNPAHYSADTNGDRLAGGPGNDRIVDNWGFRDKLIGGAGDDRLRSRKGLSKRLIGGPGADRLVSHHGYDNALLGGRGADVLTALTGLGIGRYHEGGPGRDVIDVGPGGDVGIGLTGDGDQLTVHRDASVILGFNGSPVGVEIDLQTGTARRIGSDRADRVDILTFLTRESSIWLLFGSLWADRISGTDDVDMISARAGNDTLNGNGGDDYLGGDDGKDFIDGGDGDDMAEGGAGTDTCNAEWVVECEQ